MRVGIIGGGAAGFFSAIKAKEKHPSAQVTIFEKTAKVLAKVKISGGGRCNVTNGCTSISELCKAYPRGGKQLKKAFHVFNTAHAMQWFESRGVPLITQDDQCVFPKSQDSQSIIDCFLKEARRLGIEVRRNRGVESIKVKGNQLELTFKSGQDQSEVFDKVIVTTGGSPRRDGLNWLEELGHHIENPVPSLFTFNMPQESITKLMGVVVDPVQVSIQGTKFKTDGPLLVTHWGMSGPAILKLSAFGARYANENEYRFNIQVNWVNEQNSNKVMETLSGIITDHPNKQLSNLRPYSLSERLWLFMLQRCDIEPHKKWSELGKKGLNKVVNTLTNDIYAVKGVSKFRDEFVTCGGVSLKDIDMKTMQSKVCPNLYFAGEVLDIDAITGGYNLQAAWTTGFIAGHLEA